MTKKLTQNFLSKQLPLWMVLVIVFNAVFATGVLQYYITKRNLNKTIADLSKTTKSPQELTQILQQTVLPQRGYTLAVQWKDIGVELLKSGVIDEKKYETLFANEPLAIKHMWHLKNASEDHMVINEGDARFMVNTLWALGLVNKNKILDEGAMQQYGDGDFMNFASTGGWDLGVILTRELYSSKEIMQLTPQQELLVEKIAKTVYRPCCGNHTAFPDCNHGMAALGYIQAAVKQGVSEKRIYQDILALNSFWFPQNYIEMAMYFEKQGRIWKDVDPKVVLSVQYSSSEGVARIRQQIQNVPGINGGGGGCAA